MDKQNILLGVCMLWSFSAIWLPFTGGFSIQCGGGGGESNSHVIIGVSVTSGVLSAVATSSLMS